MLPQGSAIINIAQFEALKVRAEGIRSCEDLQAFADQVMGSVNASMAAINEQLAMIKPIMDLLKAPGANPQDIVTWLTKFITAFLAPYTKPYTIYVAQAAELAAQVAALSSILQSKSASFPSCSIDVPKPSAVSI